MSQILLCEHEINNSISNSLRPRPLLGLNIIEERKFPLDEFQKVLLKEPIFNRMWLGGIFSSDYHLIIKSKYTIESGRLFINGRIYRRSDYGYVLPPIIRKQGRCAKERSDPRNNHPNIIILNDETRKRQVSDKCQCGGELWMDANEFLYCIICGLIYD